MFNVLLLNRCYLSTRCRLGFRDSLILENGALILFFIFNYLYSPVPWLDHSGGMPGSGNGLTSGNRYEAVSYIDVFDSAVRTLSVEDQYYIHRECPAVETSCCKEWIAKIYGLLRISWIGLMYREFEIFLWWGILLAIISQHIGISSKKHALMPGILAETLKHTYKENLSTIRRNMQWEEMMPQVCHSPVTPSAHLHTYHRFGKLQKKMGCVIGK